MGRDCSDPRRRRIIDIGDLTLRVGSKVLLEEFGLSLDSGDRIGITGPSGCGKTSLLRCLLARRLPPPSTASRMVFPPEDKEFRVGYCPQTLGLLPWFSLRRNLDLYARNESLLKEVLKVTGLKGCLDLFPINLSGGEYQRALLACSILLKPDLLLADEPLTELDVFRKLDVLEYWTMVMHRWKSTVIIVSHDIDLLLLLCDEVLVLSDKPARILERINVEAPGHPRRREDLMGDDLSGVRARMMGLK